MTTQRPTFSRQVIGDGGGFVYQLASGGATGSINFDFTTGSLPAGITFTRASIGTYNSSGNILTTASNNAARFNYVGGVANLLIEGSATNVVFSSNNFADSGNWQLVLGAVVTAAQFTSPDGTNNGWSMTSGTGNGYIAQYLANSAPVLGTPYTISLWMKRITGTAPVRLLVGDFTAADITTSATITRLSATGTAGAAGPLGIMLPVASGSTNGIYGAQVETGSKVTSYIPTTTAAVTRAADSAVFTIPAGVGHLLYTFDDGSTQLVTVSAGSYTIPVTLNRPNIKSIVGSA